MKKIIYRLVLFILIAVFLVSGFMVAKYLYEKWKSQSVLEGLHTFVDSAVRETAGLSSGTPVEIDRAQLKLEAYGELQKQNADMAGWIRIAGTQIDFPVMQSPKDPEYYLHRDFEKQESRHGTPFADYRASLTKPSDNIVIYGHHMNDGTMFTELTGYYEYSFFEDHQIIEFDTLQKTGQYQVAAVFKTEASGENAFLYNNYVDFDSEEQFGIFRGEVKSRMLYDTGVELQYGDELITLSTCEYTISQDARLAVVAKRIDSSTAP